MFILRPVKEQDLPALEKFAQAVSLGMLSLPKDPKLLKNKVAKSLESFSQDVQSPGDHLYLFVIEEPSSQRLVGCSGIYAKTGTKEPLYSYQIVPIDPKPSSLPVAQGVRMLVPHSKKNGPSELCSLYIDKAYRGEQLGYLASLARLLFIAQYPGRFETLILARLRGVIDLETMTSPFWEGCLRRFVNLDFKTVIAMHAQGTSFIPDFLPEHPIYVPLLPQEAQSVIQQPHPTTQPALSLLLREGFRLNGQIDLFEAGPFVEAPLNHIRTVQESRIARIIQLIPDRLPGHPYLISNCSIHFRATQTAIERLLDNTVILSEETASILHVQQGDYIRYYDYPKNVS